MIFDFNFNVIAYLKRTHIYISKFFFNLLKFFYYL